MATWRNVTVALGIGALALVGCSQVETDSQDEAVADAAVSGSITIQNSTQSNVDGSVIVFQKPVSADPSYPVVAWEVLPPPGPGKEVSVATNGALRARAQDTWGNTTELLSVNPGAALQLARSASGLELSRVGSADDLGSIAVANATPESAAAVQLVKGDSVLASVELVPGDKARFGLSDTYYVAVVDGVSAGSTGSVRENPELNHAMLQAAEPVSVKPGESVAITSDDDGVGLSIVP